MGHQVSPDWGNLCMVRRVLGISFGVTALALGGCGRKAGLDLPPNAPPLSAAPAAADSEAERAAQPGVFNPTYGSETGPVASKGRKKPFVLDPLLGN